MAHGIKAVFEIVGENRLVEGAAPPGQGFRFGRMFPELPRYRPTEASLDALGKCMTADIEVPADRSDVPAGYTYFGQFIDHDITRDSTGGKPPPSTNTNEFDVEQERSPSLDLDSLYGGPTTAASLVEVTDGTRMRIGTTTPFTGVAPTDLAQQAFPNDLPREPSGDNVGKALIGDSRNDENLIVAQLHLAFLKFHNKAAAFLQRDRGLEGDELFRETRALVTRHYQWLVLNDFVNRLTDPAVYADVLKTEDLTGLGHTLVRLDPKIFAPFGFETPPMPLEFSVAAYRLGHSMIRNGYPWNRLFSGQQNTRAASLAQLFQFTNLSGFIGPEGPPTLPSNWIVDWRRLFDFTQIKVAPDVNPGGVRPVPIRDLDTHLAPTLGTLPGNTNLAVRNLNRGRSMGIPSGQAIAQHLEALTILDPAQVLTPEQIVGDFDPALDLAGRTAEEITAAQDQLKQTRHVLQEHEFDVATPLWFYILREAAVHGGTRLGPVGSRIMVETFVGLIRCSLTSIFNAAHTHPGCMTVFSPELDSKLRTPEGEPITTMAHLLAFVDEINPLGDVTPPAPPVPPVEPPAVI